MAAKKETRASWEVDFIRIDLDEVHKKEVQHWDPKGELTERVVGDLTLAGYKISMVFDKGGDSGLVSLTSPKNNDGERQWCVSSRAPDAMTALKVMAYKVSVMLDGDLSNVKAFAEVRSSWS